MQRNAVDTDLLDVLKKTIAKICSAPNAPHDCLTISPAKASLAPRASAIERHFPAFAQNVMNAVGGKKGKPNVKAAELGLVVDDDYSQ